MAYLGNYSEILTQTFIDGTYIDFVHQNDDILVITFEGRDVKKHRKDRLQPGWGGKFVLDQGYSCLFVKPTKNTWYRSEALFDHFDSIKRSGFFNQFKRVVFTGGSMGGYGALAFSSLVPGSTVIAINPQVSLSADIAPWEKRYRTGRSQNWAGRYSNASEEIAHAYRVFIVYDPFYKPDALHVALLNTPNVEYLKIPFVEHKIPVWMQEMGILKEFMKSAIENTLTRERFITIARKRRNIGHYYQTLYTALVKKRKFRSAQLVAQKATAAGFTVKDQALTTDVKRLATITLETDKNQNTPRDKDNTMNQKKINGIHMPATIRPMDIINRIKEEKPELLGKLTDRKANQLLHFAYTQIIEKVATLDEGVVKISGFGNFRVQQLKREKNGKTTTLRRVTIKLAKAKQ